MVDVLGGLVVVGWAAGGVAPWLGGCVAPRGLHATRALLPARPAPPPRRMPTA